MLKHFMNMENLYEDIPDIMLVLCNALLMAPNESVVELMVSILKQHLPSNRKRMATCAHFIDISLHSFGSGTTA